MSVDSQVPIYLILTLVDNLFPWAQLLYGGVVHGALFCISSVKHKRIKFFPPLFMQEELLLDGFLQDIRETTQPITVV